MDFKFQYRIHLILTVIAVLVCVVSAFVTQDNVELDGDALRILSFQIAPVGGSDFEVATQLMEYSHNVSSVCYESSFIFERLAQARGLTTRHIVFTDGSGSDFPASHATSQVLIGNDWVFFDSYLGKNMLLSDYYSMGFKDELIHINCVDGACSNWRRVSYFAKVFTSIRFVHKGGLYK